MAVSVSAQQIEAVPFLDLVAPHQALEEELMDVLRRALRAAAFVGGTELTAFEAEFAEFCGTSDSVGVNSGTDALRFAYMALGVKPGDEIITVPNTFIATSEAISQSGGVVKFVDVADDSMTMNAQHLGHVVTSRTVGIVPVHLYGQSADMDPILRFARDHGLWVVEDACQAHGAKYRGQAVGSIGDLAAFSFYPGKNLGACGEGGAISGNNAALLSRTRQLREHGQSSKYVHDTEGYNGRLDAVQAGFLRVKLRHLANWNESRREAAALYRQALADVDEIQLPIEMPYADHVYHLYVIRAAERDRLKDYLGGKRIGTGLHYPLPLHLQQAYAERGWQNGDFPVTERLSETLLSLPMFPGLTEPQIDRVATAIRAFYGA